MEKISRSIAVAVPGRACNLKCSYCYERLVHRAKLGAVLQYDLETMVKAFSPRRLGGIAEIGVIASGETLLEKEVIPFVHGLLSQGHIVTVVTNATLTDKINELLDASPDILKNLVVKASLHYLELKKRNLLSTYFGNLRKVRESGASCYPFLVVSEDYLPYLEEISETCIREIGIRPYCSPTLVWGNLAESVMAKPKFEPECTPELVNRVNELLDARIFNEIIKNAEMNPQEKFCYAGMWSFKVDFATGQMYKCHGIKMENRNFYEDIKVPLVLDEPVACSCGIDTCALQTNFYAEGIIPDYESNMRFGDILYTEGWFAEHLRDALNVRFCDLYERLSPEEELFFAVKNKNEQIDKVLDEKKSLSRGNPFLEKTISDQIAKGKKIAIYGIGGNYNKYKDFIWFPVEILLDGYCEDRMELDGKRVLRPEEVENIEDYFIVISTVEKSEIEAKLTRMGLKKAVNYI